MSFYFQFYGTCFLFRSVAMNVEGTRSIIELAKKMQKLKALIHVSTAYAHCTQLIKMPDLIRKCKKGQVSKICFFQV